MRCIDTQRRSRDANMDIRVECQADQFGEETPSRLMLNGRVLEVADVIARWLAVDYRYYKVRTAEEAIYILRHDELSQRWELVMFESPPRVRPMDETVH